MITVRKISVGEAESRPEFPALRVEYTAECAVAGLPAPAEKLETYYFIQKSGMLQAFGAFDQDDTFVGFVVVLTPVIPHYGVAISVIESLFVASSKRRKTGAGLRLLRAAEAHAREAGSPALAVSAPTGGRLMRILPRLGYRETNRSYVKGVR